MANILSDGEIEALIQERKLLDVGWCQKFRKKLKHGHTDYHLSDIMGDAGNKFEIIIRKSNSDPSDFAIIFGVYLPKFTRLIRYNCDNHTHNLKIEKKKVCGFHIHYTTERYQTRKLQILQTKIDDYAEETERYHDMKGAFRCLIKDANFRETSTLF